ncbi:unnamed protein product [Closterium sp. NIES-65]|nr:unnamed protein product [Closterium sp. NIES-65]
MQAWVTPAESSSIASDDYGLTGALTASAAGKGPPTGRGGRVRSLRDAVELPPPHPASAGDAVELPPPHPASAGDAVELPPPHPASAGDAVELPPPHPASAGDAVELPPPHPASAGDAVELPPPHPASAGDAVELPPPHPASAGDAVELPPPHPASAGDAVELPPPHPAIAGDATPPPRQCRLIKREEGKSQQFECKYCPLVFSGAAIRCAQHLTSWKNMKRREVSLCKNAPHDVRVEMKSMYEKKAADAEERRRSSEAAIASVLPSGKRSRITDYLDGDAAGKKRDAHQSLALMFAGCHIAEHIVDHPLFVNAMRDVARAGDGYVPPGRKYIGGTGLQACRRGIESGLVGIKASWKKIGVTVASDMMTDRAGRPQANVFLVNDAAAVLHMCVDCNMEKKTGGYIAGLLRPVVEEVAWVGEKGGEADWGNDFVRPQPPLDAGVLADAGAGGGERDADMVLSDLWKAWAAGDADRQKAADGFAALVLDAAWWKSAEFFVKLMKLPFMAMRQTDGEAKGMMGRLYDVMLQLTEDVEAIVEADEEHLSSTDKQAIRKILKDRWDGSLACAMHVAGRILNPANQEEDIFGGDVECTRVFKAFLTKHAEFLTNRGEEGDDECDYLLALGDQLRSNLDLKGSFGMPEAIAQREKVKAGTYSMVKWWQWNGTDAPQLASLAIKILSQPVSASPCERGWAKWESVHTARRNRLGSAKCADLVYVTHNWNVVRGWHTRHDVMPRVVRMNEVEPPIPVGYKIAEEMEEEEGEDDVLADEYQ